MNETPETEKISPDPVEEVLDQSDSPQKENEPEILDINNLEYREKYLRLLAEQENARKRLTKERQELIGFAIQNVIVDFLKPIDQMENALGFKNHMSEEVKNWAIGFEMILNQFKETLSNNGVHPFSSLGMSFDPHLHNAVEMMETDAYPEGTVAEECVKGYKMGDRIIRPAQVKVAKIKEAVKEEEIK